MSFTDNYEQLERLLDMQIENKGQDHEEVTKMFLQREKSKKSRKRKSKTGPVDQRRAADKREKIKSSKVDK